MLLVSALKATTSVLQREPNGREREAGFQKRTKVRFFSSVARACGLLRSGAAVVRA